MKAFSYSDVLLKMKKEIGNNYDMIRKKNELIKKAAPSRHINPIWPQSVKDYFLEINGVNIHWRHFKFEDKPNVCGRVNLISADKVGADGKGLIWFDNTPEDSPLRTFKIIDFFVDEAAVGFYETQTKNEEMYLFLFEGNPEPLGINFEGYIQLLCEARGFFFWQQVLISLKTKKDNQESDDFRMYMPKIFPDFKFEDFEKKYQSLKIK